jgi:hypothetical protein
MQRRGEQRRGEQRRGEQKKGVWARVEALYPMETPCTESSPRFFFSETCLIVAIGTEASVPLSSGVFCQEVITRPDWDLFCQLL